ncbi:MAG: riboflavin synthase, partial [Phycisphaerae bacterium]|nr:riboflavin synthase [Phycisphaerae bacterium]
MFTGIIRHVGRVRNVAGAGGGAALTIELGPLAERVAPGDSVCVNGACLTAADIDGPAAAFDVVAETLGRTTLGALRAGDRVNLEPALRPADGLDGHLVQGHVDGVAEVRDIRGGGEHVIELVGADLVGQMVPKGSVAIDGVSLTLTEVTGDRFSVALIPTTLGETTLGELTRGARVNVECDVIGKYVRRYLQQLAGAGGQVTLQSLRDAGFA